MKTPERMSVRKSLAREPDQDDEHRRACHGRERPAAELAQEHQRRGGYATYRIVVWISESAVSRRLRPAMTLVESSR
jgi:hypothetical protein